MKKLVREIPLANGLVVGFYDATRRYFGDYHQVRVEICCEVPLSAELFDDEEQFRGALKLLGPAVRYRRHEEHHGVASQDVEKTVARVVEQFADHSLRYFAGHSFARRLVQSELERVKRHSVSFLLRRSHA